MQATKHTSKESTLALIPRADVIRSSKQGYQWPHKKNIFPPICFFFVKTLNSEMAISFLRTIKCNCIKTLKI